MNIIDTSSDFSSAFDNGHFNFDKWNAYIDKWVPGVKELCTRDMRDGINAGYSWQDNYLPILNSVMADSVKRKKTVKSFRKITEHLDARITEVFGKTVDADVVLYIGLCNGAGWVITVSERPTVLLGIEKIIELDWCSNEDMTGLILHELGHVFHSQYGSFEYRTDSTPDGFLWQLFTEGVAMVFEQEIIGDTGFYHQDKNGWMNWCGRHIELIKRSFYHDLSIMTRESQRYFGDWVSFEGHNDVGYYLGTLFVRYLLRSDGFDNVIKYGIREIEAEYSKFMNFAE